MSQPRILDVRKKISKNDQLADDLRADFRRNNVFVANLVSSPGSGKTELLRRTMAELSQTHTAAAVTGDLATRERRQSLGGERRNGQTDPHRHYVSPRGRYGCQRH